MIQEEIDLLLQDICSRLPYGVKVEYENEIFDVEYVSPMYEEVKLDIPETWTIGVSEVKPYLFPLSSMTEEQKREFDISMDMGYAAAYNAEINCANRMIDFFNKYHLDYRGLIPMGLANDATELNIY